MDVVKGAKGFLLKIFELISLILNLDSLITSKIFLISVSFLNENFSIFTPLKRLNLEKIFSFFKFLKSDVKVQYSSGLNNSIRCSLSVINFKATD